MTLIATGCEKKNEQTTLSSVAQLNAFSFAKNDVELEYMCY